MHVSIVVAEHKLKFRKGKNLGWRIVPGHVQRRLSDTQVEEIQEIEENDHCWHEMTGHNGHNNSLDTFTAASANPFEALTEEEADLDKSHTQV